MEMVLGVVMLGLLGSVLVYGAGWLWSKIGISKRFRIAQGINRGGKLALGIVYLTIGLGFVAMLVLVVMGSGGHWGLSCYSFLAGQSCSLNLLEEA